MGYTSFFDLFSIGIGPSSSHTVGPMRAAYSFINSLAGNRDRLRRLRVHLYGSLALTGEGHGTPTALALGLQGWLPDTVPVPEIPSIMDSIKRTGKLRVISDLDISFGLNKDIVMEKSKRMKYHSNGMRFMAMDEESNMLACKIFYSTGGGFIVSEEEALSAQIEEQPVPHPFKTGKELLTMCKNHNISIADIVEQNEIALRSTAPLSRQLERIWSTMNSSIDAGVHSMAKILPGVLRLPRRAPKLFEKLSKKTGDEMLPVYAIAVNEENAAGGRIVTAPTNGAAGIIPATLRYCLESGIDLEKERGQIVREFLLTASAIGSLYKDGASISAAEVGCQGEVGVACSMAAAGLTAVLGGTPVQVEHAAEIGMEHCLGLTCDPIAGLVQIPCIERNALGAAKALTAARLAMLGDGSHSVSLDTVIRTMYSTGLDMQPKYKETSQGGLAIHHPPCQ